MSQQDPQDAGIPTREIHEAFLTVKRARHAYREARDDPNRAERRPLRDYQEAVLSFYASLRPYLKRKSAMQKFWAGELPDYPERPWPSVAVAKRDCQQRGVAVWQLQKHVQTASTSPNVRGGGAGADGAATADGGQSLAEWHERLNLSDNQRVVAVDQQGDELAWIELRAVSGLRQLDTWDSERVQQRETKDGFMAGEVTTSVELRFVPVEKLERARRLLIEAADKMSLLARVDIDHEDGAIVNFDQSREGVEAEYRTAEYDSSPDI